MQNLVCGHKSRPLTTKRGLLERWAAVLCGCVGNSLLGFRALRQGVFDRSRPWHNSRWSSNQHLVTKGWHRGRIGPAGLHYWWRSCKKTLLSLPRTTRNNWDQKRALWWWIDNQSLLELYLCSSFGNENDTFHGGAPGSTQMQCMSPCVTNQHRTCQSVHCNGHAMVL